MTAVRSQIIWNKKFKKTKDQFNRPKFHYKKIYLKFNGLILEVFMQKLIHEIEGLRAITTRDARSIGRLSFSQISWDYRE